METIKITTTTTTTDILPSSTNMDKEYTHHKPSASKRKMSKESFQSVKSNSSYICSTCQHVDQLDNNYNNNNNNYHNCGCHVGLSPMALNILSQPLDTISVNPFVNQWTNIQLRHTIFCWTIGALMVMIRIPATVISLLLASLVAKIFLVMLEFCKLININDVEWLRKLGRDASFFLMRSALFFIGFYWIRVVDKRKNRSKMSPVIVAAPHSSFFDILLILMLKNPTFVARHENSRTPLIGSVLSLCNGIYVDRSCKDSRLATIKAIRERTSLGEQVLIFPEGTCANRTALLQFKLGAFIPRLPVQPVLIRFDCGNDYDSITWTWEGPDFINIFLNSLTCLSINCEITILPEYKPNDEEKASPKLFADNVAKVMCTSLGILQSFYSYDDITLIRIAKDIRLFRSPVCMVFLKMAKKIGQNFKQYDDDYKDLEPTESSSTSFTMVGEDSIQHLLDDNKHQIYHPINSDRLNQYSPQGIRNFFRRFLPRNNVVKYFDDDFQELPVSNTVRKLFDKDLGPTLLGLQENHEVSLYETFCRLIEHCITALENGFIYRQIESSDDVIELLKLSTFVDCKETLKNLYSTTFFVDLVKMLELSVPVPITTMHLLIVLHLCDCREIFLWERLRVAVRLFDKMHQDPTNRKEPKQNKDNEKAENQEEEEEEEYPHKVEPKEYITLEEFRTLLWYSLGLSEFNDQYFIHRKFTFNYLQENLVRLFYRAVNENATSLISDE